MPIDPDISLGVQGVGALGQASPLDMLGKAAQVQNTMNANRLFQAEMNAKVRFGAIMANSPDVATAVQEGMKDPAVAAFAPDLLSNFTSLNNTLQITSGLEQTQSSSAFENFIKNLPMASKDPTQIDKLQASTVATMPDGPAKQNAIQGMKSIKAGLMVGYDPTNPQTLAKYQSNLAGLMIANGAQASEVKNNDGSTSRVIQLGTTQVDVDNGGVAVANSHPPNDPTQGTPGNPNIPEATSVAPPQGGPGSATPVQQPSWLTSTPPVVHGTSPSSAQEEYYKGQGDTAKDLQTKYSDLADSLPNAVNRLQNVSRTLEHFQAGGGAEIRMDAQQSIQTLRDLGIPVPKSVTDLFGADDLANGQLFNQEISNFAVQNLQQVQTGLGKASAMELNNALAQFDKTKDPTMLYKALDFADQGLRLQRDEMNRWPQFKAMAGGDPAKLVDFPIWNAEQVRQNGIQSPSDLGPMSAVRQNSVDRQSSTPAAPNDPLAMARVAIAAGKDRTAVINRLREHGIDPSGL